MAKAKKTTGTTAKSPAAKAAPAKQPAKTPQPTAPLMPPIDTKLAAATAAKRLAHKDELSTVPVDAKKESAGFKQLKESLHKPVGQSGPSFLQAALTPKKFNNSVPGRGNSGHNQTFGADVNRTGVPRRTGGG